MVRMPDVCSPAVSPAVVYLDAGIRGYEGLSARFARRARVGASEAHAALALVNQRGLQFVPRVQAIESGTDRSVHQSRWRDAQRPCRLAGVRVQPIDGAGAVARFHARPTPG